MAGVPAVHMVITDLYLLKLGIQVTYYDHKIFNETPDDFPLFFKQKTSKGKKCTGLDSKKER